MDMKMKAEDITTEGISWDCDVVDGVVPIVSGDTEDLQGATQAGFLIRGTVPQLPDVGVPWTDFLTQKITFGELDFYVRENLRLAGREGFYPQYSVEGGKLVMTIGKLKTEAISGEL